VIGRALGSGDCGEREEQRIIGDAPSV